MSNNSIKQHHQQDQEETKNQEKTQIDFENNNNNNNMDNRKSTLSTSSSQLNQHNSIDILCFDISRLSRTWQFLILTFTTFTFYLLYGYIQELLYKLPRFGDYAWYLTLVQFFFYTCFGSIEMHIRNDLKRK